MSKRKAPEATGSVLLETDSASCEIGLFGGHVLSWKVYGKEQMFMSSKAIYDGGCVLSPRGCTLALRKLLRVML